MYAAGFTTAFGAHSIAAGIGAESHNLGIALLTFGVLLAAYDLAEVILKPVFGSLSDRIGAKPVIIGGLLAFAVFSLLGIFAATPAALGLVRLGQGAAASAFSPASSAAVARLAGPAAAGRYFGKYGSWKGLGYVLGPVIGAVLILVGGLPALFLALTAISCAAALWTQFAMPELPVLPRPRYTVIEDFSSRPWYWPEPPEPWESPSASCHCSALPCTCRSLEACPSWRFLPCPPHLSSPGWVGSGMTGMFPPGREWRSAWP